MYLLLDPSKHGTIHVALFTRDTYSEMSYEVKNRDVLRVLDEYFTTTGVHKEDVAGIMVVVGAGSFTDTRLAATVANTFAFVRQIPLLAIHEADLSRVQECIPQLEAQPRGQYLSPTYSGEPNISSRHISV